MIRLNIHLPKEHTIIFDPTMEAEDIHDAAAATTSTLLQWFALKERDTAARCILCSEVPEHYVWHKLMCLARKMQRKQLGRMFCITICISSMPPGR